MVHRILLVEDGVDDEASMLQALRKAQPDVEVVAPRDGEEALTLLLAVEGDEPLPSVVFLDLSLAKVDGLEVLKRLRADERTRLLPVVVLSTSSEEPDLQRAYALGVNGYVQKSLDLDQFAADVGTLAAYWLGLNRPPRKLVELARHELLRDDRFLFDLGELLHASTDPFTVIQEVSKRLGEHLHASRCFFTQIDSANGISSIHGDYHAGLPSIAGARRLGDSPRAMLDEASLGKTVVSCDTRSDPRTAEAYDRAYGPIGIRARVSVPRLKQGRWISALIVSSHEPRTWAAREVALVQAVADRAWLWTEHLSALEALRRSRDLFRVALEAAPTGMLMVDASGRIVLVNGQLESLFGYSRDELVGAQLEMLVPERFRARHPTLVKSYLEKPAARPMGAGRELFGLRRDGTELPVEIGLNPLPAPNEGFVLCSVVDVTERKRAERALRTLNAELEERVRSRTAELTTTLREREVLLQEVHHRVKNNLQVISSLMNMQLRKLEDRAGRDALEECQNRVQAIALIHEKLYQSPDYAEVPFSDYARSLAGSVFNATGRTASGVTLDLAIEDVGLPVDKAIPCGLMINELITNSLKHAFPGSRRGTIRVELGTTPDGRVRLAVVDDGVGLPAGFDLRRSRTLGLQLVTTLAEQVDGRLVVRSEGGAAFELLFSGGS